MTCAPAWAAPRKPNVILIMADDLGVEWLGCYGSDEKRTPHLDALAKDGMRFEHCYATPLCTPSRVCIMTGKYNHRNYRKFGSFPVEEQAKTFGNAMKKAGYATCMAGKWQLGGAKPSAMGFDRYLQYAVSQAKQQNYYWDPTDKSIQQRIKVNGKVATEFEDGYGPDIVARFITDFIDENLERPFFVYHPMLLCHAPFQPTPKSKDKAFRSEPKFSNKKWFGDMVGYMDEIVGRIDGHLEKRGIRENTLLLFTGDNGSPHTRARIGGKVFNGRKGSLSDAGTHVPLIASWPGTVPKGAVSDDLIDLTDFYATLTDLAGAGAGEAIDGVSFLPQLRGKKGTPRDWAFVYYSPNQSRDSGPNSNRGYWARTRRWKLYHDGRLHDMRGDAVEKKPIMPGADSDESGKARARLKAAFKDLGVSPEMLEKGEGKPAAKSEGKQ